MMYKYTIFGDHHRRVAVLQLQSSSAQSPNFHSSINSQLKSTSICCGAYQLLSNLLCAREFVFEMSDFKVALNDFHGLRVSSAEKSFLEIFTTKILNAKANKAGIQQEETRLMQEANFRRYGEIVSVITFQWQRNAM